jgi:hypothetical protein
LSKKRSGIQTFFSTTPYAAIPSLGVFKPGAFPLMAEKSKPPALRVVGDPEHYYEKRYKIANPSKNMWEKICLFQINKGRFVCIAICLAQFGSIRWK